MIQLNISYCKVFIWRKHINISIQTVTLASVVPLLVAYFVPSSASHIVPHSVSHLPDSALWFNYDSIFNYGSFTRDSCPGVRESVVCDTCRTFYKWSNIWGEHDSNSGICSIRNSICSEQSCIMFTYLYLNNISQQSFCFVAMLSPLASWPLCHRNFCSDQLHSIANYSWWSGAVCPLFVVLMKV